MDNFKREEEITLEDGSKYVIVDSFELNKKNYLYLISSDDEVSTAIVEVKDGILNEIENSEELKIVFEELVRRNQEEINKYIEEANNN